jgi:hypothetical protein
MRHFVPDQCLERLRLELIFDSRGEVARDRELEMEVEEEEEEF